jgi:excisionase family DNA binding protein
VVDNDSQFYFFLTLNKGDIIVEDKLLTVNELSEALRVPTSWVYSRTRETGPGAMPKVKVGKYCRFLLDDVMAWLKRQNEAA